MHIDTSKLLKDIGRLDHRFGELLKRTQDPKVLDDVAEEGARILVKRTRLGYGVDENRRKSALKPLSKRYVKKRETYRRLDPTTAPDKSNLTYTGQLLRSVYAQKATVRIPPGRNSRVARDVAERGRPFFNFSEAERSQLKRYYKNLVNAFKKL